MLASLGKQAMELDGIQKHGGFLHSENSLFKPFNRSISDNEQPAVLPEMAERAFSVG